MKTTLTCFFALFVPIFGFAGGAKEQWILEKSEITYTVTHPLHVVRGKSLSAKGKGLCDGRHCEFLVAVPVKTFDSGDNNRDLHMLQVTKAGLYPMIEVNAETGEIQEGQKPQTILSDLEITFAGKKVNYPKTSMNVLEWKSGEVNLEGEIILSLKAFDITPPSLLTMPVQDAVPVKLEMTWKKVDTK
jgi:hypothetical protein